MALTKEAIASGYPLPAYNYRVTIGSDTLSFSEVSGLNIEYEKVIYKDGSSYKNGAQIIRSQVKEVSITLKRGIVPKRQELFKWLDDRSRKDLMIDLCDPQGIPVVRWKVQAAVPLKLDAPSFSASGTDIAIESIEVIARHLSVEHL